MPRFSANLSLLFTEYPLLQRFAQARKHGFDAVEIQFPYELEIEAIQAELTIHDLKLVLINVPAGDLMQGGDGLACVPGQEQAFRQGVFDAARYARALNIPTVNVLAGRQPVDMDLLPCLHVLAANLRFAMDILGASKIQTVLEAINGIDMPRFLIQNVVQMEEMLEAVNTPSAHYPLKMQFDCYHMAMMGEDIALSLHEHIDEIGHIQFADCPGRHEPGTGQLPYDAIFALIDQLGYHGYCGAEYRPSGSSAESFDWLDFNSHPK